ncbi:MAG: hypothetical protein NT062_39695 [Proteobacteria bacterium]|nr:hypothetical protein [Pseudomonadota bacterium]
MGKWAKAKRDTIVREFEAASGDMRGEIEPTFITARTTGEDVLAGEITRDGSTMRVAYRSELDADDVAHVFAVAYLDELTMHHDRGKIATIVLVDQASGAERTIAYPA